jgi:4-amino-4-deoxy-L-arabinose transferase-like glycosyltransferase
MVKADALATARSHWPFLMVSAIAAALLLTNLGAGYLWADEGDTAVLASNIVRFGVPKAWDGTTFMDSDFGARVNKRMIMVSSPWLQYYITAASFLLFGENTFAARLPFVLAGLLTIGEVYFLTLRATANGRAALLACILTTCSVQFLLFCRQSRYYAFAMLLTCLLIDIFLRMTSAKRAAMFGIVAVLLFHTHPIGVVPVFALGALTLIHPAFSAQRRWFGITIGPILMLTIPWFLIARTGYTENAELVSSVRDFIIRSAQYLIECSSVAPLIGVAVLCLAGFATRGWAGPALQDSERRLLVSVFAVIISYVLAMAGTQRAAALWVTGVRYTSAIIPLFAVAAAVLVFSFGRTKRFILPPLVFLFAFTKFAQITPWICWADKGPNPEHKIVALHVPTNVTAAFFPVEDLLYVKDLWQSNIGTVGHSIEFLRQHAQPGDLVITNYESEPLYFHTKLPQGMKIMKQDTIYDAARSYGLPEYVFGVGHVQWIVWRFNWDDYLGIHWAEVKDLLLDEGAKIDDLAEIKETGWENRENIHFHRFSGDTYLFEQETNLAPAHIFRVDWPAQPQAKLR